MTGQFYRLGVDVGGTNTDCALASFSRGTDASDHDIEIVSSYKTRTSNDINTGICSAIEHVLEVSQIPRARLLSVNIGTTHFINAVVQADPSKLSRVAVLRLCGPFCREVPPFAEFPSRLRATVAGYSAYLDGGLEIDGRTIAEINPGEVARHAEKIRSLGIRAVVVIGVFSSIDTAEITQENQARLILEEHIPGVDVVCSRDIGNGGFIERENASILNASILEFGRRTIGSFIKAISALQVQCPLYLTQNDGTIVNMLEAARKPIHTFSSGATNSLSGALFLSGLHRGSSDIDLTRSQVLMVDVGGTTTDVAALSSSGFPRQSNAVVHVGGVRTAFSMPEVLSIGLGGGSKVIEDEAGTVSVGPLSVGNDLVNSSQCFGGTTLTTTDVVVASGVVTHDIQARWTQKPATNLINKARENIRKQLEQAVDAMKTSDIDTVVLLVGGGSFLQMDELRNVKRCIRPPHHDVANAVGAAIAKVSGTIDCIRIPGESSQAQVLKELREDAIQAACDKGALRATVKIVEMDAIPLQYTSNGAFRAIIKAVGTLDSRELGESSDAFLQITGIQRGVHQKPATPPSEANPQMPPTIVETDPLIYTPEVSKATGEWFVSESDLDYIAEGAAILGTGGGGSVYTGYLHSLEVLRSSPAKRLRIIDSQTLSADSRTAAVAYIGAPSVSNERLVGNDEFTEPSRALARYMGIPQIDAVVSGEIGGSNGMRPFAVAAALDVPVVDTDLMGRAFPRVDMALPYVFEAALPTPAMISDCRGNIQICTSSDSPRRFENLMRAAAVELGLYSALTLAPLTLDVIQNFTAQRSVSLAWYLGRAIKIARRQKTDFVEGLATVLPGTQKLVEGKIVDVSRKVERGWTVGTATITLDISDDNQTRGNDARNLMLQYQNEFLYAARINPDGSRQCVCTTPDLISVLDQDGTAISTHVLRYGLQVCVISMPVHKLWKMPKGMEIATPKAFGLDMEYEEYPYSGPTSWPSVIQEFAR